MAVPAEPGGAADLHVVAPAKPAPDVPAADAPTVDLTVGNGLSSTRPAPEPTGRRRPVEDGVHRLSLERHEA